MGASSHVLCVVLLIAACMIQAHTGAASGVPSDWAEAVAQGDILFAATDPAPGYFPYVGNGYVATELFTNTTYLAGVFNGISNSTQTLKPFKRSRHSLSSLYVKRCRDNTYYQGSSRFCFFSHNRTNPSSRTAA